MIPPASPAAHAGPLLLTLGDSGGLGPELACSLLPGLGQPERPVVLLGALAALKPHLQRLALEPFFAPVEPDADLSSLPAGYYLMTPPGVAGLPVAPGRQTVDGGRAAGLCLQAATELLAAGQAAGVVTCPLDKAMLMAAGFDFPGHTEFLAQAAGLAQDDVTMHLCGDRLRVSLVTTHPPLSAVPGLITRQRVQRAVRHTADFVARLGLTAPLAVCGLNPHAGESGRIGREDIEVVGPALDELRGQGFEIVGPLPADTLFHRAAAGEFSAVVAMYHDQGLPPLKLLHFGQAINVTLGLPHVRTSVDHGTGYDLVGTGKASTASLRLALDMARQLVGLGMRGKRGQRKREPD